MPIAIQTIIQSRQVQSLRAVSCAFLLKFACSCTTMPTVKFGARLKELRVESGMSQKVLAALLDMDIAYLSRIENDLLPHLPTPETIRKMAQALKLADREADELYMLAGKIPLDIQHMLRDNPKLIKRIRAWGQKEKK
jgi:transcriptional regulator with XRE-family HTH domain